MDGWLDKAMGLELEANEIEAELEWAEAQGRHADAADHLGRLKLVLGELASLVELTPAQIHAPRARNFRDAFRRNRAVFRALFPRERIGQGSPDQVLGVVGVIAVLGRFDVVEEHPVDSRST